MAGQHCIPPADMWGTEQEEQSIKKWYRGDAERTWEMAGSAGWAGVTYREQALPLQQRTSSVLDAIVGAVRICKITRQPGLQGRDFVVSGKSPLHMEGGLLGSVIEMLTNVLTSFKSAVFFGRRCCLLFPVADQKLYMETEQLFPSTFGYFWEKRM